MEKLRQEGAIHIEIIRQQEGASIDQMQQAAMDLIKEQVLKDFFTPVMTGQQQNPAAALGAATAGAMAGTANTSTGKAGSSGGTSVQIGFQLQYKKQEELKTISFDFSASSPETRKHCPNGFFSALVGPTEKRDHIRDINLQDPFFQTLDVQTSTIADFEAIDLKAILVDLQYGGTADAPGVSGTIQFGPGHIEPKTFQASRNGDDLSYRYRVGYEFGQAERVAAQKYSYQTPWLQSVSRALVINPPEHVSMLQVYLEPGVIDWDIVQKIETRLRYADPGNHFAAERTYLIGADSQRQQWTVRLTNPAVSSYYVRHLWHLKDGSSITGPEERSDVAHLFIGDPFVDRLPIIIQPQIDSAKVLRVVVELRYADPDNNLDVRKNVELVGPNYRSTTVTLPIMNHERREYSYQVSLIKTNGGAENHALVVTEDLSIVITEGGVYFDVNLVLIGDLAQRGLDAVQVDLRAEPPEGEVGTVESILFERGGDKKAQKRLLLRADKPRRFEYRTTAFLSDGTQAAGEWTGYDKSILPLQLAGLLQR